jgi:5'(3')-deoxyribonucleotidase
MYNNMQINIGNYIDLKFVICSKKNIIKINILLSQTHAKWSIF